MESRRVCVRGLIAKDGKLFAQKLKNDEGSAREFWCTPGGGMDLGESLHEALTREMVEETGVAPTIGRLVLIQQFSTHGQTSHGDSEQLEFFFEITNVNDYESIDLAATSHGDIEIAEYDFIDPNKENILPTILRTPEFQTGLTDPHADVLFYTALG